MGAAAVLETAAETPPMRKSVRNALASLGFRATSDIFTKTKGQRFGKKKLTSQAELIRRSPIESGSSSNVEKNIGRPIHDPTIFFPFFPRKHGVKHAHLFFPALSSNATVLSQAKGEVRTYFVNLVSTSYRENEKSGEVKEKEKERKR